MNQLKCFFYFIFTKMKDFKTNITSFIFKLKLYKIFFLILYVLPNIPSLASMPLFTLHQAIQPARVLKLLTSIKHSKIQVIWWDAWASTIRLNFFVSIIVSLVPNLNECTTFANIDGEDWPTTRVVLAFDAPPHLRPLDIKQFSASCLF